VLFTKQALEGFSRFLGVPMREEHLKLHVNITEKGTALPKALRRQMITHYADVYAFCRDRFPQTRKLWQHGSARL